MSTVGIRATVGDLKATAGDQKATVGDQKATVGNQMDLVQLILMIDGQCGF
ncbi:hypothetical protein [Paenibacillus chungangensis]|uniref:Uncharacterized protein n=1 Tax=Paenibacillus chungangensis TaxID=696535 RepID=A0ABW3HRI2_9BACL